MDSALNEFSSQGYIPFILILPRIMGVTGIY